MLAVTGQMMSTAHPMLQAVDEPVFEGQESGVRAILFSSVGRWGFAPRLCRATQRLAAEADFIVLHSLFSYAVLAGYSLARKYNKPYGVFLHGVLAPVQRDVSKRKKAIYQTLAAERILRNASALFFTAEGEREETRSLDLETPSVVIPLGVDRPDRTAPGAFREKFLGNYQGPIVLFLGRLNIKKGLDLLASAMAQVLREMPDARLVIAGSGHPRSFEHQVREWVSQAGITNATAFTGLLDQHDRDAALADCDMLVLPSIAENFGHVLFEAMASAKPVICSETVNYAGEVRRNETGLVVPRTVDAFSDGMLRLLREPGLRARLGENGRRASKAFSWDACGEKLETALGCIIGGRRFPADLSPENG